MHQKLWKKSDFVAQSTIHSAAESSTAYVQSLLVHFAVIWFFSFDFKLSPSWPANTAVPLGPLALAAVCLLLLHLLHHQLGAESHHN